MSANRAFLVSAGSALLGLAGSAVGLLLWPQRTLASYLVAFTYWAGLIAGGLILLCIFHAAKAKWVVALRRSLESFNAGALVLPLLFLPIALGLKHLFSWVNPPAPGLEPHVLHALHHKHAYLNVPFFLGRAAIYLVAWWAIAELLRRWSLRQDARPGDEGLARAQHRLGAGGLPLMAVTLTFASFDWLMSLDPTWFSTIFGIYYFAGSFLGVLAVLTLTTVLAGRRVPATGAHLHNLGKLLLAFVCFWLYIGYSQYLLIWIANLPEEVVWYLPRTQGAWRPFGVALIVGHFLVPFLLLLSRPLKLNRRFMLALSGWLLVFHYFDLYGLVMPALYPEAPVPHLMDLVAFLGIGGAVVATALFRARGVSPVAVGDPQLADSLRYVQP